MRTLPALLLLLLSHPVHAQPVGKQDRTILPGKRVGPITPNATEATLKKIFGPKQVQFGIIAGPEGSQVPGTRVLPNTPDELQIFWKDEKTRTHLDSIVIFRPDSHWHTPNGVRIGTPLAKLVQLNDGRPLEFSGFDWDYGGGLTPGPKLKAALPGLGFQLSHVDPKPPLTTNESAQVIGEQTVKSNHPALARLKPYVNRIFINF